MILFLITCIYLYFSGLLTAIDPFMQFIPKELHSEYLEDFLKILLPQCEVSEKGTISIPFTIITCLFKKQKN